MTPRIMARSARSSSRCHFARMLTVASAITLDNGSMLAGSTGGGAECRGLSGGGVTRGDRSSGSHAARPEILSARRLIFRFWPRVRGSLERKALKSTVFAVVPPVEVNLAPGGVCPGNTLLYSSRPRSLACRLTLATLLGCGLCPFAWTMVLAVSRSVRKQDAPNEATTPISCAVNRVAPNASASPAALLPRS